MKTYYCKICRAPRNSKADFDADWRCPSCADSHNADLMGIHYGDWIAKNKPPVEGKPTPKQQPKKKTPVFDENRFIPDMFCQICGKPIPFSAHSTVTCGDPECKYERQKQQNHQWYLRANEGRLETTKCVCCGKEFQRIGVRKKTCSTECSLEYAKIRKREAAKRASYRAKAIRAEIRMAKGV